MPRYSSIINLLNRCGTLARNSLGYLKAKAASLSTAAKIASITFLISTAIATAFFIIRHQQIEKNREEDEIERRFSDLKRDLFSNNLSLVSIAVEDLAREFGGVIDTNDNRSRYIPLAYELLGKRFVSLAPDRESQDLLENKWTGELKKLCGKIILYTAYFPLEVDSIKPWEIQGKYLCGLNLRRTYSETSGTISDDFDPSVVNMLNETHSRPHLMYALINDCDFSQSELMMINLSEAKIENTSFYNAKFMACTLNYVILNNCDLRNSTLKGTYIKPAMMLGTDLRGALIDSSIFFGIDPAFLTTSPGYSDSTILWWDRDSGKVVVKKGQYRKTVYK